MAIVNCPECGQQVSTRAESCPHCGYRGRTQLSRSSGCFVTAVKVVGIGVAAIFGLAVLGSLLPKSEQSKRESQRIAGIAACRVEVEGRLKAPSTASFPGYEDVRDKGGGVAIVISSVDAQNSFGAKIRSRWICEVDVSDPSNTVTPRF